MSIKVAHVITRLDCGGAQYNTLYTVEHLDPKKFDATLFAGRGGYMDTRLLQSPMVTRIKFVRNLVRQLNPIKDLNALANLSLLFNKECSYRPDIVHTHSSKAGVLGRLAAWFACVPVIIHTYHGFAFHDYQPRWLRWLYVRVERWLAKITTALVFVSEDNVWTAVHEGILESEKPYYVIRSGIDFSKYKKSHMGKSGFFVVGVGNDKPQKNAAAFWRIAALVRELEPKTDFVYYGDKGVFSNPDDVAEALSIANVYLSTSLWEGLPRSLVEAMKSECVPVCYATDGVTDLVEDGKNGYLVRRGDEAQAARIVVNLLRDPEFCAAMGQRAERSIGPDFRIQNMVRQQEALYKALT